MNLKKKVLNKDIENIVRNVLIILTIISLIITLLHFTYNVYNDNGGSYLLLNDFLIKYIDGWLMWTVFILLIIFAISYIKCAIKYKKETTIKIAFSIFALLTNMIPLTFIVNFIAKIFKIL